MTAGTSEHLPPTWPARLVMLATALLVTLALFWQSFFTMVQTWWQSDIFSHAFLIVPISAYLAWSRRGTLVRHRVSTDFRAVAALAVLGLTWAFSQLAGIVVLGQLAAVAMIPALVWLLFGAPVTRGLAFPLAYLVFTVPFGQQLIPPLIDITAGFTVGALRLTNIPVYSQGTVFEIPTGTWSVVEGCSGIRYLIASFSLGVLYAYVMYSTLWRRLAFVLLALSFPILANGMRAYLIVMLAHLSNNQLAMGIDHFIYGWVFFSIVMLIIFWLGTFWRRGEKALEDRGDVERRPPRRDETARVGLAALVAGTLALAIWPAWAAYIGTRAAVAPAAVEFRAPSAAQGWTTSGGWVSWSPKSRDAAATAERSYRRGPHRVGLFMGMFRNTLGDGRASGAQLVVIDTASPLWTQRHSESSAIRMHGEPFEVREHVLESSEAKRLLVWRWYWMGDRHIESAYGLRLRAGASRLLGMDTRGAAIVVFTEQSGELRVARQVLQGYLDAMLPAIEASLRGAARSGLSASVSRPELAGVTSFRS